MKENKLYLRITLKVLEEMELCI
ncbi:unnamed protein product [Nezara viridula]|uniref:Uncharacterized protein n=1 Tax=Nezara viridula TaxID=85310 RepID=A0A9P0HDK2_NEZVI|nr:unnamed protein product [Nezara viridula]